MVAESRESAGLHEYDGVVQDLSPDGVKAGLDRLSVGDADFTGHDRAHLEAIENGLRFSLAQAEEHRRNPVIHLANLDLACYDRSYAPVEERDAARRRHLAAWPDAVDAAIEALDQVPALVAEALLPAARGLAAALPGGADQAVPERGVAGGTTDGALGAAWQAHGRLVAHLERSARIGVPEVALGATRLASLMADGEAMSIDLSRLETEAARESARLRALLDDACVRLRPGLPTAEVVARLVSDHPGPDGVAPAAAALIDQATDLTLRARLLPELDGDCLVGPAPESRRWAMAMMSWSAPYEADAPSWYYVTPPDPSWPVADQEEWMAVFSHTTLPAITVHEVMPGHFAHGRMLRRASTDVRRGLHSPAFIEGWAHYAEELMFEEGFRSEDPRYCIGMCVEALVRATRLGVAIGLHSGAMTISEAVRAFEEQAFLKGAAARSEASRATYDPTYGRYTWGKLEILRLRDEAMAAWGSRYSHLRFHEALLGLGAPPLGLIGDIFL